MLKLRRDLPNDTEMESDILRSQPSVIAPSINYFDSEFSSFPQDKKEIYVNNVN